MCVSLFSFKVINIVNATSFYFLRANYTIFVIGIHSLFHSWILPVDFIYGSTSPILKQPNEWIQPFLKTLNLSSTTGQY